MVKNWFWTVVLFLYSSVTSTYYNPFLDLQLLFYYFVELHNMPKNCCPCLRFFIVLSSSLVNLFVISSGFKRFFCTLFRLLDDSMSFLINIVWSSSCFWVNSRVSFISLSSPDTFLSVYLVLSRLSLHFLRELPSLLVALLLPYFRSCQPVLHLHRLKVVLRNCWM